MALEALEKSGGFDLVLMDVQMPEMDGLEATRAIRDKEKATGEHLPIIAITAHAMKGDRERCLQASMDGYITKPVRAKALFEVLEGVAPSSDRPSLPAEQRWERKEPADWGETLGRLDGDQRLLADMVKLVRNESRKLLSAMREAITRQDARALGDPTHTLEISLSNFTGPGLLEPPRSRKTGRETSLSHAEEAYVALEEEFERVREALADLGKGASR